MWCCVKSEIANHRRQEKGKPPQLSKRHFLCDAVVFTQINLSCFKFNHLLSGLYAFKGLHLLQATQKRALRSMFIL